jgi:hypothetical protein
VECTVLYTATRERDPESACLTEMVYADLRRRGFMVYRLREPQWPEAQPDWDYIAYIRVAEERARGKRLVELTLELPVHPNSVMARTEILLDTRASPSEDVVSRLVGPALEQLPASVPRDYEGKQPCPNRALIRAPPEPDVSKACGRWSQSDRNLP